MRILLNASKEKAGGGIQVSDSLCSCLNRFPEHQFIVVVPEQMHGTYMRVKEYPNVRAYEHTFKDSLYTLATGRYAFLDKLVENEHVDAVLTVFGPCRWTPKVMHVCGFARAQLVMLESPYYTQMGGFQLLKCKIHNRIIKHFFNRSKEKIMYSENPMISPRVEKLFKGSKCYTVTNYYNQVFDHPDDWRDCPLAQFDGVTMLTVSAMYAYKNLPISIDIARYLKSKYPEFMFRFVFTCDEQQFPVLSEDLKPHFLFIGRVDVSQCPSLYQQCDICFQPTLLECFTATYPEAMRMEKPIVTTDLEFARGLCGNSAAYYSAMDAASAAEQIYRVATDESYKKYLVKNGKDSLRKYDDYNVRARKLIDIVEKEYQARNKQ